MTYVKTSTLKREAIRLFGRGKAPEWVIRALARKYRMSTTEVSGRIFLQESATAAAVT